MRSYIALGSDYRPLDPSDTGVYRVGDTVGVATPPVYPIHGYATPPLSLMGVPDLSMNTQFVWAWPSSIVVVEGSPLMLNDMVALYEQVRVVDECPIDLAFGPNGRSVLEFLALLNCLDSSIFTTLSHPVFMDSLEPTPHFGSGSPIQVANVLVEHGLLHAAMTVSSEIETLVEMMLFRSGLASSVQQAQLALHRLIRASFALMCHRMIDEDLFKSLTSSVFACLELQAGVEMTEVISQISN